MKRTLSIVVFSCLASSAMGFGDEAAAIHRSKTDGSIEGGWVVSNPSGSSDYFNVRHDFTVDTGIKALSISVADFGTSNTFPFYGIFNANLGIDPSGDTPDLWSPISLGVLPPLTGLTGLFDHCDFQLIPVTINGGSITHAVVQFPPGDPGLLGVGADTDSLINGGDELTAPNPHDSSGFTTNGYATPSGSFGAGDFALNPVIDPCAYVSVSPGQTALRIMTNCSDLTGDYEVVSVEAGGDFGFHILGEFHSGAQSLGLIMFSSGGVPLAALGAPFPLLDDGNDCTSSLRACGTWPCGAGGLTFNFVSITGCVGVIGSVRVSNEVTVATLPDPPPSFLPLDDGGFESGWVVQSPGGPSDYFATSYINSSPGSNVACGMQIAILDFGATVSSFPRAGVAPPNIGLDPSGVTPDVANPYVDAPFSFPALTFATTSAAMATRFDAPYVPAGDAAAYVQFVPGDLGLLGIAADSSTAPSGRSTLSVDGYLSPGIVFGANWGIRIR